MSEKKIRQIAAKNHLGIYEAWLQCVPPLYDSTILWVFNDEGDVVALSFSHDKCCGIQRLQRMSKAGVKTLRETLEPSPFTLSHADEQTVPAPLYQIRLQEH